MDKWYDQLVQQRHLHGNHRHPIHPTNDAHNHKLQQLLHTPDV